MERKNCLERVELAFFGSYNPQKHSIRMEITVLITDWSLVQIRPGPPLSPRLSSKLEIPKVRFLERNRNVTS